MYLIFYKHFQLKLLCAEKAPEFYFIREKSIFMSNVILLQILYENIIYIYNVKIPENECKNKYWEQLTYIFFFLINKSEYITNNNYEK